MDVLDRKEIEDNISFLIKYRDVPKLKNLIISTHPADLADILQDLQDEERDYLFSLIDAQTASEVMVELDEVTREDIVSDLETKRLSEIVDEMDSDDATDVVAELPDEIAEKVLSQIEPQDRAEVEKLLMHEEDTAGGIMALEFITVYEDQTVHDAIQQIRQHSEEVGEVFYIYAIDRGGRLVGIVPLIKLFLRNPRRLIRDIMQQDFISVTVDKDQEEVANIVRKYDLPAVPVVDQHNRLVGRITVDDIVDVLHEEANEDIQRMAGISDEEVLHETSALKISKNRLPWLIISFLGELGSALVLDHFDATLSQIIIAAFFIPVIMATGGNSGIQSSTIVVRSIALNEGGLSNVWSRIFRELRVSLLNGFIIAVLLFTVIFLWKNDLQFGLVGGFSIMLVIMCSAAFGTFIPFALHKLKIDPAIATGPFITTTNDILGLLIYLSSTTLYLYWTH